MSKDAKSDVTTTGSDLVAAVRAIVPKISEGAAVRDADRVFGFAEMDLVRKAGVPAARVPAAYGGSDCSMVELCEVILLISSADPNLGQSIQPHFVIIDWLLNDATEDQRRRYFAAVVDGALFANAFAEIGKKTGEAGTSITADGTGYRLDGTKFYSTGSLYSDYMYSSAVRDDGMTCIVMYPRAREGVTVIDDWHGMGQRTTASGTTQFKSVRIEADEIIPMPRWNAERNFVGTSSQLTHAAIDVGIAFGALRDSIQYVRSRKMNTEDPYVVSAVGQMTVIAHGAEAILYRAAAILDRTIDAYRQGRRGADLESLLIEGAIAVAEAKAAANEASLKVSEMMYQVGGASMTVRSHNFDRHWRNARTHTTHDPVAQKYKLIGDFKLRDLAPPISMKV